MGERFLGVDVFATLHSIYGRGVVGMVRGGDGYHVDLVVEFGKHFTIILKGGGAFELFGPSVDLAVLVIDVAQSEHLYVFVLGQVGGVDATLASGADMSGADFAVG